MLQASPVGPVQHPISLPNQSRSPRRILLFPNLMVLETWHFRQQGIGILVDAEVTAQICRESVKTLGEIQTTTLTEMTRLGPTKSLLP